MLQNAGTGNGRKLLLSLDRGESVSEVELDSGRQGCSAEPVGIGKKMLSEQRRM